MNTVDAKGSERLKDVVRPENWKKSGKLLSAIEKWRDSWHPKGIKFNYIVWKSNYDTVVFEMSNRMLTA